jgi:hypothetical protein
MKIKILTNVFLILTIVAAFVGFYLASAIS